MSAASSQTPPRGGYPVEAFARIAAVENGNYWFESRNRLIAWAIQRYFPEARTFLDVGCGTGYVLAGLATACPQLKLAGADFMDEGLEFARRRVPSATFVKMDAQRLDIPEPADVAGSFDVLEHIEEDVSVMKRLREVIRPGGGLLIAVPQHRWLWSSADAQAQHVRRYTRREMVTKLESAGFEVLRVTSFISVLLPLMALSRWRDARKTRGPSASELHVSSPVNTALRAALTAERALIRAGLSFPAGGSLFVIARRASGPAEPLPRRRPEDHEDQEKDRDRGCRRLG